MMSTYSLLSNLPSTGLPSLIKYNICFSVQPVRSIPLSSNAVFKISIDVFPLFSNSAASIVTPAYFNIPFNAFAMVFSSEGIILILDNVA